MELPFTWSEERYTPTGVHARHLEYGAPQIANQTIHPFIEGEVRLYGLA